MLQASIVASEALQGSVTPIALRMNLLFYECKRSEKGCVLFQNRFLGFARNGTRVGSDIRHG